MFPEFEFTWLGEEMRENLPKEMDFVHEQRNAERAAADFANVRTSLYIRECSFSPAVCGRHLTSDRSRGQGGEETDIGDGVHPGRSSR